MIRALITIPLLCRLAAPAAQTTTTLHPQELESGIVTTAELNLSQRWFDAVTRAAGSPAWVDQWLGTALPFRFRYGGTESSAILPGWQLERGQPRAAASSVEQDLTWKDPATGLEMVCKLRRFTDSPAGEWVLTFRNTGQRDSPVLEDIQALDLRL
jgi:hypothetical protein